MLIASPVLASGILWFGAHPDDEFAIAPRIGELCGTEPGKTPCQLVVMTRGEGGGCPGISGGCSDSEMVAAVRQQEMRISAFFLRSSLTQWNYTNRLVSPSDPASEPIGRWEREAGGRVALLNQIKNQITAMNPDLIVTFDPRHGSTCHQEHLVWHRGTRGLHYQLSIPGITNNQGNDL